LRFLICVVIEEAVAAYEEALGIRRRLAQQQPQVYAPDVATTLNNLGIALYQLRRLEEAVAAYEEALGIRRRLAQQQPQVYAPDVATTLTNLGNALYQIASFMRKRGQRMSRRWRFIGNWRSSNPMCMNPIWQRRSQSGGCAF
jgi:tetratricopeptide (TPR) repeat protein